MSPWGGGGELAVGGGVLAVQPRGGIPRPGGGGLPEHHAIPSLEQLLKVNCCHGVSLSCGGGELAVGGGGIGGTAGGGGIPRPGVRLG